MVTQIDKFLMSLLPAITMAGAYFGADISVEWYQALVTTIAPALVWLFPNRT